MVRFDELAQVGGDDLLFGSMPTQADLSTAILNELGGRDEQKLRNLYRMYPVEALNALIELDWYPDLKDSAVEYSFFDPDNLRAFRAKLQEVLSRNDLSTLKDHEQLIPVLACILEDPEQVLPQELVEAIAKRDTKSIGFYFSECAKEFTPKERFPSGWLEAYHEAIITMELCCELSQRIITDTTLPKEEKVTFARQFCDAAASVWDGAFYIEVEKVIRNYVLDSGMSNATTRFTYPCQRFCSPRSHTSRKDQQTLRLDLYESGETDPVRQSAIVLKRVQDFPSVVAQELLRIALKRHPEHVNECVARLDLSRKMQELGYAHSCIKPVLDLLLRHWDELDANERGCILEATLIVGERLSSEYIEPEKLRSLLSLDSFPIRTRKDLAEKIADLLVDSDSGPSGHLREDNLTKLATALRPEICKPLARRASALVGQSAALNRIVRVLSADPPDVGTLFQIGIYGIPDPDVNLQAAKSIVRNDERWEDLITALKANEQLGPAITEALRHRARWLSGDLGEIELSHRVRAGSANLVSDCQFLNRLISIFERSSEIHVRRAIACALCELIEVPLVYNYFSERIESDSLIRETTANFLIDLNTPRSSDSQLPEWYVLSKIPYATMLLNGEPAINLQAELDTASNRRDDSGRTNQTASKSFCIDVALFLRDELNPSTNDVLQILSGLFYFPPGVRIRIGENTYSPSEGLIEISAQFQPEVHLSILSDTNSDGGPYIVVMERRGSLTLG